MKQLPLRFFVGIKQISTCPHYRIECMPMITHNDHLTASISKELSFWRSVFNNTQRSCISFIANAQAYLRF